jgi:hypothetical protein
MTERIEPFKGEAGDELPVTDIRLLGERPFDPVTRGQGRS